MRAEIIVVNGLVQKISYSPVPGRPALPATQHRYFQEWGENWGQIPIVLPTLWWCCVKGAEGIARVFFCTQIGKRIVVLHSFIKKSARTPLRELEVAHSRLKELKHANS